MATKAELQAAYDKLKENFLGLKDQIEELKVQKEKKHSELEEPAFAIYLDDNGFYKLVELKYNPLTKEAMVVSIDDAARNNRDYALAHAALKKANTEVVMKKVGEKIDKLR